MTPSREQTRRYAPQEHRSSLPYRLFSEWQEHEGMVTVYDDTGQYLGCMGIESWRVLLAEGDGQEKATARHLANDDPMPWEAK